MRIETLFSDQICKYLEKEIFEDEIYAISKTQKHDPIIIDCGANVGYSIAYFKKEYPNSTIYGFEPDKQSFELLKKNIAFNRFTNVHIYQKAVTNHNGLVNFFTIHDYSKTPPVMSLLENQLTDKLISVKSIDLGSFIDTFNTIDFCKIDVEGAESLIFESLFASQNLKKIQEFVVEYHHWVKQEYSLERLIAKLEKNGFICSVIKKEIEVDGWESSGNTIFRATNTNQHFTRLN